MTERADTKGRRWLHRLTLGSGPLKRRSDRVQVLGRLVVLLSFVLAPPLAVAAGTAATAHYEEVAAVQTEERSRTQAVLLEDAPVMRHEPDVAADGGPPVLTVSARARWSAPGGLPREGTVLVPPRTAAGTSVPVWVDGDGRLTRPPLDRARISGSAATVAAIPLIGVPVAAWIFYAVLCTALDAHRERRWAQDWAKVEPEWNSPLL